MGKDKIEKMRIEFKKSLDAEDAIALVTLAATQRTLTAVSGQIDRSLDEVVEQVWASLTPAELNEVQTKSKQIFMRAVRSARFGEMLDKAFLTELETIAKEHAEQNREAMRVAVQALVAERFDIYVTATAQEALDKALAEVREKFELPAKES